MSLTSRVVRAATLATLLLSTPALAEGKKVALSQAFQSMLYLPLYVAIDEGFFTQQGIDLTKETAGAPSVALSAVLSGSAQFSLHGPEGTEGGRRPDADNQHVAVPEAPEGKRHDEGRCRHDSSADRLRARTVP